MGTSYLEREGGRDDMSSSYRKSKGELRWRRGLAPFFLIFTASLAGLRKMALFTVFADVSFVQNSVLCFH